MSTAALVLAGLAVILALVAMARAGAAQRVAEEAASDARRRAANAEEAARSELGVLRAHVARLAAGESLTPEMIREGLLWRDVGPAEARPLVEAASVAIIDVRTAQELMSGRIPGAVHVPMEEVEGRMDEIPRDRDVLIYCAGGGRSAAICEALAQRGWERLLNLDGGIGAWDGPLERS